MVTAEVADEDGLFLNPVALLVGGRAHVDAVLVVEAPTDGVSFDDSIAHLEAGEV